MRTGASGRNWESYGDEIDLPPGLDAWRRDILTDPQTSGGLLIAVAADQAQLVLAMAKEFGSDAAAVIGKLFDGEARMRIVEREPM